MTWYINMSNTTKIMTIRINATTSNMFDTCIFKTRATTKELNSSCSFNWLKVDFRFLLSKLCLVSVIIDNSEVIHCPKKQVLVYFICQSSFYIVYDNWHFKNGLISCSCCHLSDPELFINLSKRAKNKFVVLQQQPPLVL